MLKKNTPHENVEHTEMTVTTPDESTTKMPFRITRRMKRSHKRGGVSRNTKSVYGMKPQSVLVLMSNGTYSHKMIYHRPKPSIGVYFKNQ
jgi:hypothetical protein